MMKNDLNFDEIFDCCENLQVIASLIGDSDNLPCRLAYFKNLGFDSYRSFLDTCLVREVDRLHQIILS